jgi:AcrR family transcriptional regulator
VPPQTDLSADQAVGAERSAVDRIRTAALENFAAHGAASSSLRSVAAAAGVSLGLVQHHFATKAGLIKAVDDYVLGRLIAVVTAPMPNLPQDSISEIGARLTRFIAEEPHTAEYIARSLSDGSRLGSMVFDTLLGSGLTRWTQRSDRGETRSDLDLTWAAINSLVLALGTLILRPHIDRHLAAPLMSPDQLNRWQAAVDSLLRQGMFRPVE